MIELQDIKKAKYLLFHKLDCTFARRIFTCIFIKESFRSDMNINYNAKFRFNTRIFECKVVYRIATATYYLADENGLSYELIEATNNFIELLELGDIINYKFKDNTYLKCKVVGIQAKYGRYIVQSGEERHNLSTILRKFGSKDIIGITTYDYTIRKAKEGYG